MNENDTRIVRVTNISNFDFTGEMGARYAGRDFALKAGESRLMPFTVGDHIATHLARQILLRKAPVRDASQIDGRGSDRPLWDDKVIENLKKEIMKDVYEEQKPPTLSEGEKMEQKVADLNKVKNEEQGGNADASGIVPTGGQDDTPATPMTYKDKAQVIAELNRRGISHDARGSKASLEKLLNK